MDETPTGTSNRTTPKSNPRKFPFSKPSQPMQQNPPLAPLDSDNKQATTPARTGATLHPRFLSSTTDPSVTVRPLEHSLDNTASINLKGVNPSAFSNLLVFNGPFYFSFHMKGSNKKKSLHSPVLQPLTIPVFDPNFHLPMPNRPIQEPLPIPNRPIQEPKLENPALSVDTKISEADLPPNLSEEEASQPVSTFPANSEDADPNAPVDQKRSGLGLRNVSVSDVDVSVSDVVVPVSDRVEENNGTGSFTAEDESHRKAPHSAKVPIPEALADFFRTRLLLLF